MIIRVFNVRIKTQRNVVGVRGNQFFFIRLTMSGTASLVEAHPKCHIFRDWYINQAEFVVMGSISFENRYGL